MFRIFHYFFFFLLRINTHGKTFTLANHYCHPSVNKKWKIVFKKVGMQYRLLLTVCTPTRPGGGASQQINVWESDSRSMGSWRWRCRQLWGSVGRLVRDQNTHNLPGKRGDRGALRTFPQDANPSSPPQVSLVLSLSRWEECEHRSLAKSRRWIH